MLFLLQCLSTADLFEFYSLPPGGVNVSQVLTLVPGLLYEMQNELCYTNTNGTSNGTASNEVKARPSLAEGRSTLARWEAVSLKM